MPHNRFFTENRLNAHDTVCLTGDEAHHIRNVMRSEIGEMVELVNGMGQIANAKISAFTKKEVHLELESVQESPKQPKRLFLALPLLRPGPFDWVVEKAVELGVDCLIIYPAAQSEKKEISDNMLRRLEKLVFSATKQSGRLFTPEIQIAKSIEDILTTFSGEIVWADKNEHSMPILEKLKGLQKEAPLVLLAGPEKGWSTKEKQLLAQKATPVLLSHNVLRAETAAIVLVTCASM